MKIMLFFYNYSLIGVQADQMVLRGLVPSCLPEVDTLLQVWQIFLCSNSKYERVRMVYLLFHGYLNIFFDFRSMI